MKTTKFIEKETKTVLPMVTESVTKSNLEDR